MSLAVILVLLALVALLILVRAARARAVHFDSGNLVRELRSVDVEAFRNLTDAAEDRYLRSHLPGHEFRRVRRKRLRAAAEYVRCASRNAAILTRMGETARRSPEASVAEAGARLVDSAAQLRLYALGATGKLYLAILFPGLPASAGAIPQSYERMADIGMTLGRLRNTPQEIPAA